MTDRTRFGLALVADGEKPRRKKRPSDAYVGKWVDSSESGDGHYEMSYTPSKVDSLQDSNLPGASLQPSLALNPRCGICAQAGDLKLFLWYETAADGRRKKWERTQLPGSPFSVECAPGKRHAPSRCDTPLRHHPDPTPLGPHR